MNKGQFFILLVFIAMICIGVEGALSCQDQGNNRGAICVFGSCPQGWRSVFWNTGCRSGNKTFWGYSIATGPDLVELLKILTQKSDYKMRTASKSPNLDDTANLTNTSYTFVIKPGEKWRLDAFCRKAPERISNVTNSIEEDLKQMLIVGSQQEEDSSDLEVPRIKKSKSKSKKKKSAIKQQKYCEKLSVPRIRESRPPPDPYSYDYYFDEKDSGFSRGQSQTRSKEKWDGLVTSSNSKSSRISTSSRKKGAAASPVRYLEYTVPLKDGSPNITLNEANNPKSERSNMHVDNLSQRDQEDQLKNVNLEDKEDDMRSTVTNTNSDKSFSADDFKEVVLTQSHPISAPVSLTPIIKKVQFPDNINHKVKSSTAPNDTRTTWDSSRNKIKTEENSKTKKISLFNKLVNPLKNVKPPQQTEDFHLVQKTKENRASSTKIQQKTLEPQITLPVSIMKLIPPPPPAPVKKRGLFNFADKYATKLL